MISARSGTFAYFAPLYRELGMWPRPITPGTKACRLNGWSRPDGAIPAEELETWLRDYGHMGIGLLMGSPLPDGTRLGAVDIDDDRLVNVGRAMLRDPISGRFGSKGAVFFVRYPGALQSVQWTLKGRDGKPVVVAECLFAGRLCVLPPTIHPGTGEPYRWIGTPLHELDDFSRLPLVGA